MEEPHGWRGVFAIPCTPFTDDGALDRDGLAAVIEFCVNAGAHGTVAPVLASDYPRQFPGNPLDRYDRLELDRLLDDIEDLFTLAPLVVPTEVEGPLVAGNQNS